MDKKFLDKLMKIQEKEEIEVKKQVGLFYEDGERMEITTSSDKDPFTTIFSGLRKDTTPQTFTENQMLEKCSQIREYVKRGKPDNIEINFTKMLQRSNGSDHDLHNTLIKALAMDADTPVYLHIIKGDILTSLIFIGGDDAQAFLVTKDEDNRDTIVRLSEFSLLSISENSTPEREVGMMTSYSWMGAKVHTSIIMGMNLDPIKTLLVSEGLRNINTGTQKTNEIARSNTDEYA